LPITYESAEIITNFCLPRKYTSTHNDATKEIYMSIGHQYNPILLASEEAVKVQSQVVGKWSKAPSTGKDAVPLDKWSKDKKSHDRYIIYLTVLVSTPENPQAFIRNKIFCEEMGPVLEGLALAETALLKLHPHLGRTRIYIHFKSIDPAYDRTEYWRTLGYWAGMKKEDYNPERKHDKVHEPERKKDKVHEPESDSRKKKRSHKKKHSRKPHVCQTCH
jgi:hypothetical protein